MIVRKAGRTTSSRARPGSSRRISQWYTVPYPARTSTVPPSTSGPSARAHVALWPQAFQVDGSAYSAKTDAGSTSASWMLSIVQLT